MVGAVIVAHSHIGRELIATAEYIAGEIEGIVPVSIGIGTNVFEARKRISQAVSQVDQRDGILLLVDVFGSSLSSIVFSFLSNEKTEVITGVNLPMIVTFRNYRESLGLPELAKAVQLSGTRSVMRARDLTEKKGAFGRETGPRARQLSQ